MKIGPLDSLYMPGETQADRSPGTQDRLHRIWWQAHMGPRQIITILFQAPPYKLDNIWFGSTLLGKWMTLETVGLFHRILDLTANNGRLVQTQCNNRKEERKWLSMQQWNLSHTIEREWDKHIFYICAPTDMFVLTITQLKSLCHFDWLIIIDCKAGEIIHLVTFVCLSGFVGHT